MKAVAFFCVSGLLWLASDASAAAALTFERINGAIPFEGMAISNQFEPYYGISFRRGPGASSPWPVIARVGEPNAAFNRPGATASDTMTAAYASLVGEFFLTDDSVPGQGETNSLILDFTSPISQASGYILDIDSNEHVTISAYPDATETNALQTITLTAGDPNTGDGVATLWSIVRPSRDIRRIEIAARGPMGYDVFVSNYTAPPATPASLQLRMYPGLTIQGDIGRPYRVEYADQLDTSGTSTNWHFLATLFLPSSPYFYLDNSPTSSPDRFYRAIALP